MLYELSRGLAYRSIRHPHMRRYTVIAPAILTIVAMMAYYALPVDPVILGKDGLLASSLAVLSTLPGFYFAGLAAVATFGGPYMDRAMPDPAPEIDVKEQGVWQPLKMSRRQFLSYLFSYLTVLSLGVCVAILGLNAASPSIDILKNSITPIRYGTELWWTIKFAGLLMIFSSLASILVTTLHGMFFLSEKIHQP